MVEYRTAAARGYRIYNEVIFIDQTVRRELRNDTTAAENRDSFSWRLLDPLHLGYKVAPNQFRIAPGCLAKRSGKDDFRHLVHPLGYNRIVRHRRCGWPISGHQFIRDPAKQQLAALARVLGHERAELGVIATLVCPSEVAISVGEVTVKCHIVKDNQFSHAFTAPFLMTREVHPLRHCPMVKRRK